MSFIFRTRLALFSPASLVPKRFRHTGATLLLRADRETLLLLSPDRFLLQNLRSSTCRSLSTSMVLHHASAIERMPAESGRGRSNLVTMLGRGTDKENARATSRETPSSPDGDQREPHPPRLESGPRRKRGPGSKRGKPIAAKSNRRAALLARKKRGYGGCHPTNHAMLGRREPTVTPHNLRAEVR